MGGPPILFDLPDRLESERLILRSPMPGDGQVVHEAIVESWESLRRWMPWARERPTLEQSEEVARRARANFIARTDLPVALFLRDGTTYVGGSGLHRFDWSVPRFEIGYWVRRSFEGHGYVTEAVKTLTHFAFTALAAERVEIHCSHRNERSQRVAERAGYVLEGRLRNHGREVGGELRDTLIYSLVRSDAVTQRLLEPLPADASLPGATTGQPLSGHADGGRLHSRT
jgi:RimJ/RimL family protein N-acetyltransferase